jgi:hypothetical protein
MKNYSPYKFILQSFGLQTAKVLMYEKHVAANGFFETDFRTHGVLGTPVFDKLILDTEDQYLRIDTVIIDVSMVRNIVKTAVSGLDGTIKEYINDGDYSISVKGLIASEDTSYPEDVVNKLITILQKKTSIRINSNFLTHFGIADVVVDNYSLKQQEGFENIQLFELSLTSDKAVEIVLSEKDF